MRIPTGAPFVLFQFTGDAAGRVMFHTARHRDARKDFEKLVARMHASLGLPGLVPYLVESPPVKIPKGKPVLAYRMRGDSPSHRLFIATDEEKLTELCHTFQAWLVHASAEKR